jgi:O-methyltransferase involved in polyketide biosynthesis
LVAPRSPLIFTYVHRRILEDSEAFAGATTTMRAVQRSGEPFTFGFDPAELAPYLADRSFDLESDTTVADIGSRYYTAHRRPELPEYYRVVIAHRI